MAKRYIVWGNGGGSYLIARPNWKGEKPSGVKEVIRSETEFVFALYLTQLFNQADIVNVEKVQTGNKTQALSQFLGTPAPTALLVWSVSVANSRARIYVVSMRQTLAYRENTI